jgi:hypothetical protein
VPELFSQLGATGEVVALALTLAVHVLGGFTLIYMLVREGDDNVRDWWPGDDDDGPPPAPRPRPSGGGDGLPLPSAEPSGVRLREPGTIADGYGRPARRPAHPEREPVPAPQNS